MLEVSRPDAFRELQTRWQKARDAAQDRNRAYEEYEDLYFGRHWENEGPEREGEERVTLSTHTNVIDLGTGILTSQDFRIMAFPSQEGRIYEQNANAVERWLYGVLTVNNERQEISIRDEVSFCQSLYGMAVVRTVWDWSLAGIPFSTLREVFSNPQDPQAQQILAILQNRGWEDLPIVIQNVNPKNIYPMAGGGGRGPWKYIIYADRRTVAAIEEEWGDQWREAVAADASNYATMPESEKLTTEIEYIDYWGWEGDKVINAVSAGDVLIKPPEVMEGYKDLPYTIIPCKRTSSDRADEQTLGMLFPIKDIVHDLERTLTKQNRAIRMHSWMPPVYTGPPGQAPSIDASLGDIISLPPGSSFGFPQAQTPSPDVPMHITVLKQEIQEGSYPSVTYGQGPGAMSGYALSTLSEGGRIRLQMPRRAQELGWQIVFRKCLSLAMHFSPTIPLMVWGDWKGQPFTASLLGMQMRDIRVLVRIGTRMPQDKVRDEAIGIQVLAQNVMSKSTALERYYGIDDPDKEIEKMFRERIRNHPLFQLLTMAKLAIEEEGMPPQLVAAAVGPMISQVIMAGLQQPGGQPIQPLQGQGRPQQRQVGQSPPQRPRVGPTVVPGEAQGRMTPQESGLSPAPWTREMPQVPRVMQKVTGGNR